MHMWHAIYASTDLVALSETHRYTAPPPDFLATHAQMHRSHTGTLCAKHAQRGEIIFEPPLWTVRQALLLDHNFCYTVRDAFTSWPRGLVRNLQASTAQQLAPPPNFLATSHPWNSSKTMA